MTKIWNKIDSQSCVEAYAKSNKYKIVMLLQNKTAFETVEYIFFEVPYYFTIQNKRPKYFNFFRILKHAAYFRSFNKNVQKIEREGVHKNYRVL